MNEYSLKEFSEDVVQLTSLIKRLSRFIDIDSLIILIKAVIQVDKKSYTVNQTVGNNKDTVVIVTENLDVKYSLTDKLKAAISSYGTATNDMIYEFFVKKGWMQKDEKIIKHSIRSVLASLKQRGKIVGNAKEGFSIKKGE